MDIRELFDLTNRVALVTGGTGIYDSPISEALAESGAHVIIASRDETRCQSPAEQLRTRGLKASADQYDQSSESSILELRDRLVDRFGSLNILVNNSVCRSMGSYQDSLGSWRESLDVNGAGVFSISRAILESMMERRRGTVINIGSIQSVVAPDFANYDGTEITTPPNYHFHKHGLIGLTKYLAGLGRTARCSGQCDLTRRVHD